MSEVDTYYASLKHFDDFEKYKHLLPIPFNPNTEEGKNITEFIEIKNENREIEKKTDLDSVSEKIETD